MNYFGKVTYTSRYIPERVVTNTDLSQYMETSDQWIQSRTGIQTRHVVTNENTSDLCINVARQLLEKSGKQATDIDFILVATISPDYHMPSVACLVQGAIGAKNAIAFDVSAACSGFVYAFSVAEKMIRTGTCKTGIIIGGETLSKVLDWSDRSTAALFGDGAAGVLYEATTQPHVFKEQLQADGTRACSLTSGYQVNQSPFAASTENAEKTAFLTMNGREIFDFALNDVPKNLDALLDGFDEDTIDYFLFHQANVRMIDMLARKMKKPREKFLTNMDKYGNTSAASIPILLDEAVENGLIRLDSTQTVVLTGFGGGLTWGSILLTL